MGIALTYLNHISDSDDTYLAVQNLTVLYVGPTTITVRWNVSLMAKLRDQCEVL